MIKQLETIPNQPTIADLLKLAEIVMKINNVDFTQAMANALYKAINPSMRVVDTETV